MSLRISHDGTLISEIRLEDIKRATIEEGIGIARLVVETNNGSFVDFAFFTKKKVKQFRTLANIITNKMIPSGGVPPISDEEETPSRYNKGSTFRWLLDFMQPYRKKLMLGILFSVLLAAFSLVPPYLLAILIDRVLISGKPSQGLFVFLTLVLLGSFATITILTILQNYFLRYSGAESGE